MYAFLIIIAVLSFLLICGIFRLWKKSNRSRLYASSPLMSDKDGGGGRPELQCIETDWPTTIETPDGNMDAVTINFSNVGAFIRCLNPLPIGAILSLKIHMPDKDIIDTKAKVVWTNVNVPVDRVVNRGMGVVFIKDNSKGAC